MIIAALAWLYVIGMIALTVGSAARGIATFLVVGVLPLAFIVWILGRRVRKRSVLDQRLHRSDGADAQGDEQHLLQGGGQVHPPVQSGDQVGHGDVDHARRDKAQ